MSERPPPYPREIRTRGDLWVVARGGTGSGDDPDVETDEGRLGPGGRLRRSQQSPGKSGAGRPTSHCDVAASRLLATLSALRDADETTVRGGFAKLLAKFECCIVDVRGTAQPAEPELGS